MYEHLCMEKKEKEGHLKQCRYEEAYCQHYLDRWPPAEALEWVAFTFGELPLQLNTPTVEPCPKDEGPPPLEGQDPPTGNDVEMQDDTLQGAVGGKGVTGGASPVTKEDEEMLSEEETPQTQVISDMKNLTVRSPSNPTSSRSETKL